MSHFCLFFSFPWMCIRIKWGYVLHILCGLLLGWTCLHAVSILECFFTPNSLLVTVGDTMRGMGSFPCPQEPVVWVRDHLSGILLSSMVTGVLALCLSPAADTATASEFFHQEKKKSQQPPSIPNWSESQGKYSFISLRSAGAPLSGHVGQKPIHIE